MKGCTTTMKKKLSLVLLVAPLIMLPGCLDWFKQKLGGKKGAAETTSTMPSDELVSEGEVLVTMGGAPIISSKSFERDFAALIEENPQLKSILPLMPDAPYNFLQGMVSQEVVDKYIAENKIDETPEYQKDIERGVRTITRITNKKHFDQKFPAKVSDAEVQKFYDENKESIPELLLSRGGVKSSGVSFNNEADAKAFAAKAKGKDFAKVAREANVTDKIRDFKFVTAQSVGIDKAVQNRIIATKHVPATEVIKGDDKAFWVVNMTEIQQAKYRPFEQIKAGLKQHLEKEKQMAEEDKEINQLKEKYGVVINEEYFKKQKGAQAESKEEKTAMVAPTSQAA